LLPGDIAWSYLTRQTLARTPRKPDRRPLHLIVSDVTIDDPRYGRLNPWQPEFGPDEEPLLLKYTDATPSRVMQAMRTASEIDLVTHGDLDLPVSSAYLKLATEHGQSTLTLPMLRDLQLQEAPFVVLAACRAAHTTYSAHEGSGFPTVLIEQGARGVLAATEEITDLEANQFFNAIRARIRQGTPPAIALRDERRKWLTKHPDKNHWLKSVLLFE